MHKIKIIYDQDIAAHITHNNFQIIEMHIKTGDELKTMSFQKYGKSLKDSLYHVGF